MRGYFQVLVLLLVTATGLKAQHTHHSHNSNDDHNKVSAVSGHRHHHERNEIGLSTGALYGLDHKEWGPGIHLHYFRTLGDHSRWAVGAFGEYVWLDDGHYSFGVGVRYEPVERLHFGVFPGIIVSKHSDEHDGQTHDEGWKARFSGHFEIVYDVFQWDKFHLGPAFDYSWSKNDSHIMIGVHAAFCF